MHLAKQRWIIFCRTTGIKGLNFYQSASSNAERAFWLLTVCTALGVTVWDVTSTIHRFTSYPTATKVVFMQNTSFTIDQPTICAYVDFNSLNVAVNLSNSTVVASLLSSLSDVNLTEYFEDNLKRLSDKQLTDDSFEPLIYLSSMILSHILSAELTIKPDINNTEVHDSFINEPVADPQNLVSQFLKQKQFPAHRLLQSFTIALCYYLELWVVQYVLDPKTLKNKELWEDLDTCKFVAKPSWFGPEPFLSDRSDNLYCFMLDEKVFTYKRTFDRGEVYANVTRLSNRQLRSFYWVASGEPVIASSSQNTVELSIDTVSLVTLKLTGHFKSMESNKKSCWPRSELECLLDCRAKHIAAACGCRPLFSAFIQSATISIDECSDLSKFPDFDRAYEKCLNISHSLNVDSACTRRCYPLCEHKIYNYDHYKVDDNYKDCITLNIYMDTFAYPMFKDVIIMDFKQFLAQVGSNLSLWLGASFLVLVHAVGHGLGTLVRLRHGTVDKLHADLMNGFTKEQAETLYAWWNSMYLKKHSKRRESPSD